MDHEFFVYVRQIGVIAIFSHSNITLVFLNYYIFPEVQEVFIVNVSKVNVPKANKQYVLVQMVSFLSFIVENQNINEI